MTMITAGRCGDLKVPPKGVAWPCGVPIPTCARHWCPYSCLAGGTATYTERWSAALTCLSRALQLTSLLRTASSPWPASSLSGSVSRLAGLSASLSVHINGCAPPFSPPPRYSMHTNLTGPVLSALRIPDRPIAGH